MLQHETRAAVHGWLEGAAERFPARRKGLHALPASSPDAETQGDESEKTQEDTSMIFFGGKL